MLPVIKLSKLETLIENITARDLPTKYVAKEKYDALKDLIGFVWNINFLPISYIDFNSKRHSKLPTH